MEQKTRVFFKSMSKNSILDLTRMLFDPPPYNLPAGTLVLKNLIFLQKFCVDILQALFQSV